MLETCRAIAKKYTLCNVNIKTVVRLHDIKSCVNLAPDGGKWSASGPVSIIHEGRHSVLTDHRSGWTLEPAWTF